jgi:hypothetical protein
MLPCTPLVPHIGRACAHLRHHHCPTIHITSDLPVLSRRVAGVLSSMLRLAVRALSRGLRVPAVRAAAPALGVRAIALGTVVGTVVVTKHHASCVSRAVLQEEENELDRAINESLAEAAGGAADASRCVPAPESP